MEGYLGHEPDKGVLLSQLAGACEAALTDAGDWYGSTTITGTIIDPERYYLAVTDSHSQADLDPTLSSEELVDGLAEGTRSMAVHTIALCILPGPDTPAGLATVPGTSYRVEEQITEIPGHVRGHIGMLRIDREVGAQNAGELATVINMNLVPGNWEDDQQSLYAHLWLKDGQVVEAEIRAMDREDAAHYSRCIDMFGESTLAVRLMEGLFKDEDQLATDLALVRRSALDAGVYEASAVDDMLAHVQRMGLKAKQDREQDRGVTPERLNRLIDFAQSHTNAQ